MKVAPGSTGFIPSLSPTQFCMWMSGNFFLSRAIMEETCIVPSQSVHSSLLYSRSKARLVQSKRPFWPYMSFNLATLCPMSSWQNVFSWAFSLVWLFLFLDWEGFFEPRLYWDKSVFWLVGGAGSSLPASSSPEEIQKSFSSLSYHFHFLWKH